jgi:CheY-like chemotaxis protein
LAVLQHRLDALAAALTPAGRPPAAVGRSLPGVLLVGGNVFGRETLGQILEADGYRVARARNADDGLRHLRRPPHPGLVLLDMPPPCLDGWLFVRAQERDRELRDIPVIVLSSIDTTALCRPFRSIVAHFEKPVAVDRLLAAVHQHLPLI